MKLTIINQFFPPDLSPTAHFAASLAQHRVQQGDDVTIVTSSSRYVPHDPTFPAPLVPKLTVRRLWAPDLGRGTLFRRAMDYAVFYLMALRELVRLPPQDVVIAMTTPPLIAWTAAIHKLLHPGTRVILWNMDCYPDVLERANLIQLGGPVSSILGMFTTLLFRRLDRVICLDAAMRDLLRARYARRAPHLKFEVIPNWEPVALFPKPASRTPGELTVLYLGNAGVGHTFETTLEAGRALKDSPIKFVFVGGGAQWRPLKDAAEKHGLSHFSFEGYLPKEKMPELLARCDLGLITLKQQMAGVMSPSKLHSYLAMGLPVIYIGPEKTNVDEAIRKFGCGISLREGDIPGLLAFLRSLDHDRSRLKILGAQARVAFEQAYCDVQTVPQFDAVINR